MFIFCCCHFFLQKNNDILIKNPNAFYIGLLLTWWPFKTIIVRHKLINHYSWIVGYIRRNARNVLIKISSIFVLLFSLFPTDVLIFFIHWNRHLILPPNADFFEYKKNVFFCVRRNMRVKRINLNYWQILRFSKLYCTSTLFI